MHNRILLVDDDTSLLKLLSIRLEAEGYQIQTAESAEDAIQVLRNEPVELVVTDLRMDGASGLELFEQVRHYNPGMPVIIMSAQGTIPEAVAATGCTAMASGSTVKLQTSPVTVPAGANSSTRQ